MNCCNARVTWSLAAIVVLFLALIPVSSRAVPADEQGCSGEPSALVGVDWGSTAAPAKTVLLEARRTPPYPGSTAEPPLRDPSGDELAIDDKTSLRLPDTSKIWPASTPTEGALSPPGPGSATADLTPELIALRDKVRRVLTKYYPRHQNTRDNTPWEVMHAIIAYGVETQLFKGGPDGERVNAVGWTCYNQPCAGQQMLFVNRGQIDARRGVGVQGHAGQFLAILAQSRVKSDYPMYVSGKYFTVADLVEHEKQSCVAGEELTFKLISLMHYCDSDDTWTARDGQPWSIQRLVQEELKQPIRGAACGGTHRLMGFSYSVNKRVQRGKQLVGEFKRAQAFIQDYHRYTFSLQNPDGSFSTEWFTRRGSDTDIDRRLKTSGHILEWISFSLSDAELRDPRMIKAVDYLATILDTNDRHTWEIGPLGHGLHGLSIYNNRMFDATDVTAPRNVAETSQDVAAEVSEARRPGPSAE